MLGIFLFVFCTDLIDCGEINNGLHGYWQKTPPTAALAQDKDLAKTYIDQLKSEMGSNVRTLDGWTITGKNHEEKGSLFFASNGTEKWKIYVSNFSFANITKKIVETFVNLYKDLQQKNKKPTEPLVSPSKNVSASTHAPAIAETPEPAAPSPNTVPTTAANSQTMPPAAPTAVKDKQPAPPTQPPVVNSGENQPIPPADESPKKQPPAQPTGQTPPPAQPPVQPTAEEKAEEATVAFEKPFSVLPTTWPETVTTAFKKALKEKVSIEKRQEWTSHAQAVLKLSLLTVAQVDDLFKKGFVQFEKETKDFMGKIKFDGITKTPPELTSILSAAPVTSRNALVAIWNTTHVVDTGITSHLDVLIGNYVVAALKQTAASDQSALLAEISINSANIIKWLQAADTQLGRPNIKAKAVEEFAWRLLVNVGKKTKNPATLAWTNMMDQYYTQTSKKSGESKKYVRIDTPDFKD